MYWSDTVMVPEQYDFSCSTVITIFSELINLRVAYIPHKVESLLLSVDHVEEKYQRCPVGGRGAWGVHLDEAVGTHHPYPQCCPNCFHQGPVLHAVRQTPTN